MPSRITQFGNDLYTGTRSINFVGGWRVWYFVAAVLVALSVAMPFTRGVTFSIDFRGGSQFQILTVTNLSTAAGEDAVNKTVQHAEPHVTLVGHGVQVQTNQLTSDESRAVTTALAKAYGVVESDITTSFIGPTWGADITRQAVVGLIVFLLLAGAVMAIYFRTWKMSLAAILSLLADLVITVGVYIAVGFPISPAATIGVLTILSYSLYDTVVVFDKIRENTRNDIAEFKRTYGESINLAVNQTLVRSINTSIVAALPVAAILFIGAGALGADTLRDISLALLIGIIVGTWSTVFIAAPMYAQFRSREPNIVTHDERVARERGRNGRAVVVG